MEKISQLIRKASKIPYIVWFFLMAGASFCANIYENYTSFGSSLDAIREAGFGEALAGLENSMFWTSAIFGALISVGFFELIIYFIYKSLSTKGILSREMLHVKNVMRTFYMLANVLVGFFNLFYFLSDIVFLYGTYVAEFLVYTASYTLCYLVLAVDSVNPRVVAKTFMRVYSIYFGLLGFFAFVRMITSLVNDTVPTSEVISATIGLATVILAGIILYFTVAKKLKEKEKKNREITIIPPTDLTPPPPDDEIYKGFGF